MRCKLLPRPKRVSPTYNYSGDDIHEDVWYPCDSTKDRDVILINGRRYMRASFHVQTESEFVKCIMDKYEV